MSLGEASEQEIKKRVNNYQQTRQTYAVFTMTVLARALIREEGQQNPSALNIAALSQAMANILNIHD